MLLRVFDKVERQEKASPLINDYLVATEPHQTINLSSLAGEAERTRKESGDGC